MITAEEALTRLQEGNSRFVTNVCGNATLAEQARPNRLVKEQKPFAIILGCSDSRVPAEIVFDQGIGQLFVIRVAGNVVAPSQIASVEFAAEKFETRLVLVVGHSRCGAVEATLEELQRPKRSRSVHLGSIVDRISPSIEGLLEIDFSKNPDELMRQAVRANIRASVNHLRHGSEVLERLTDKQGLLVVGAEYSLDTGAVDFFYGLPESVS